MTDKPIEVVALQRLDRLLTVIQKKCAENGQTQLYHDMAECLALVDIIKRNIEDDKTAIDG